MKQLVYIVVLFLSIVNMTQASVNPLLVKYKTPFETPPFDKIKTEHYEPAFEEGIKQLDEEVKAIASIL